MRTEGGSECVRACGQMIYIMQILFYICLNSTCTCRRGDFLCFFRSRLSAHGFSTLLWDCRVTSRLLNNESKRGERSRVTLQRLVRRCRFSSLSSAKGKRAWKKLILIRPRPCAHRHQQAAAVNRRIPFDVVKGNPHPHRNGTPTDQYIF